MMTNIIERSKNFTEKYRKLYNASEQALSVLKDLEGVASGYDHEVVNAIHALKEALEE